MTTTHTRPEQEPIRRDFELIARAVPMGAKVLDVGCGDGALLSYLRRERQAQTRGMELSVEGVQQSIKAGHAVVQGDADRDLCHYPDNSFDVVILTKTLQATTHPDEVLRQITRIGKKAVVGFTNFGHYSVLLDLVLHKRMPVTKELPLTWYETPNIHFCTIKDFAVLAQTLHLHVEEKVILNKKGRVIEADTMGYRANWFGAMGIFTIRSDMPT